MRHFNLTPLLFLLGAVPLCPATRWVVPAAKHQVALNLKGGASSNVVIPKDMVEFEDIIKDADPT